MGDIFYKIGAEKIIAFDYLHDALSAGDRRTIRDGLLVNARYRMKAMDAWWHTPNLVFKPTFAVALTGLVTRDRECLEWGFRRTKPHGPHLGGYFTCSITCYVTVARGTRPDLSDRSPGPDPLRADVSLSRTRGWPGLVRREMPDGGSPRGLMDYYIDTAYPMEKVGSTRRIRAASYGDGSTSGGRDLFLIYPGPNKGKGPLVHNGLADAYNVSGDSRYAAFLALLPDYKPNLLNRRPLPSKPVPLPAAPSKVWPSYGLAMLRSDESPSYWTSGDAIAVFQLMGQGYGHDHRDKFSLTLHGAGRLFYPDYNALQYEKPHIGWTMNSVAHNTL